MQKGNDKRKRCAAQKSNTSLNVLSTKLREHGRHALLSFLCSLPIQVLRIFFLPIPVLRILDMEANRFYDKDHQMYDTALLIRCYTQHTLHPLIDSEINHKRHFIKITFINKGIDFIDISSVFQNKSVSSSIPEYFQNSELHIIYYKYNKQLEI